MQREKLRAAYLLLLATFVFASSMAFGAGSQEPKEPAVDRGLVVALSADVDYLDPNMSGHTTAQMLMTHVADNLIRLKEGQFVPWLAHSWEFSDDDRALTIQLRQGVRFHDGTPFNAEVVKLNFERMEWSVASHFLYPELQNIEVVDEYTVTLHFDEPYAAILPHLAHPAMVMLSGEQVKEHFESGKHINEPIGTAAFVFTDWERGERLRFDRNPDYWADGPYVDSVTWRIIPDDSTRRVLLETKDVDVIMAVSPIDAAALDERPDVTVSNTPSIRNVYIGMNVQAGPFDDVRVRQALNYAVDKKSIVEDLLLGAGSVTDSIVGPEVFGYCSKNPYPYDPERARKLLDEAGYPDGFEATFFHPTGRYLEDAEIAEVVQFYLADIGVSIKLETMEWATYMSALRAEVGDPAADVPFDMFMWGWAPGTVDAHHGIRPLLHSESWPPQAFNVGYYSDDRVDRILDQAVMAVDEQERRELYCEVISLLWEDAPWIFLHIQNFVNAKLPDVHGIEYLGHEHLRVHEARLDR